ncbi:hypothetical protein SEA_BANTAM_6 [Gordonia phage Bantam]|uniref:Uncharacterized protein n=1 Tax=Gordonia phage Bantam TaxID=1887641 RepID=A0A1B3AY75_9CAUD|nr:hypothetical protein BIZ77_gp006 [Gordonia phage Bantam]AOE43697.1 hypothetical protein SEA_BANTAM_6 [Gordonia phage Bantam]
MIPTAATMYRLVEFDADSILLDFGTVDLFNEIQARRPGLDPSRIEFHSEGAYFRNGVLTTDLTKLDKGEQPAFVLIRAEISE